MMLNEIEKQEFHSPMTSESNQWKSYVGKINETRWTTGNQRFLQSTSEVKLPWAILSLTVLTGHAIIRYGYL